MMIKSTSQGFTLLEILLVVIIVGIMTIAGVNLINSQSIERIIMNHAKEFEQNLNFLCEKAVFENQAIGIEFHQLGYQAYRYQRNFWQLIESEEMPEINSDLSVNLLLGGVTQDLVDEGDGLPQIVCQVDGSFNPFELRLAAKEDEENFYAINSSSPWALSTKWHAQ